MRAPRLWESSGIGRPSSVTLCVTPSPVSRAKETRAEMFPRLRRVVNYSKAGTDVAGIYCFVCRRHQSRRGDFGVLRTALPRDILERTSHPQRAPRRRVVVPDGRSRQNPPGLRGPVNHATRAPLPAHTSRPLRMHPRRTGIEENNHIYAILSRSRFYPQKAESGLFPDHATWGRQAITPSVRARTSGEARQVATAS